MNRRTLSTKRRPPKEIPGDVTQAPVSAASLGSNDGNTRRELIAVEAYFLAERRGFTPGCELDDWLAAEAIVERRLRGTSASSSAEGAALERKLPCSSTSYSSL